MRTSDNIAELACALAKAQGEFTAAERAHVAKVQSKKGEGSSYSYNYADLAAYLDVCREPLAKHGLAFIQSPKVNGVQVAVTTLLVHSSGQFWESDPLEMTAADPGPQTIGSILTYCRRYSLSASIGMASEADDDAVSGSGFQGETGKRAPRPECPECGSNKHVYEDRQKGGFFCWKAKGGCGHNWMPGDEESPQSEPESKAKRVAAEHGMTTADKLPQPSGENYKRAIAKITEAVRNRDVNEIARIMNVAEESKAKMSANDFNGIVNECTLALKKIKALESEPEHKGAAA